MGYKEMNKTLSIGLLAGAMIVAGMIDTQATSYASPQSETIKSTNGKYTLITNPKTKKHKVYASDDLKTELWSFELAIWHFPIYLSNDGEKVCHLAWRHVKAGNLGESCVTRLRTLSFFLGFQLIREWRVTRS